MKNDAKCKIEYDLDNFYVYREGKLVSTVPLKPYQKAQLKAEVEAILNEELDMILYGISVREMK